MNRRDSSSAGNRSLSASAPAEYGANVLVRMGLPPRCVAPLKRKSSRA